MTDTGRITEVRGTLKLNDGLTVEFLIDSDSNWHQWSPVGTDLGRTSEITEAIRDAVTEYLVQEDDEDEVYAPDTYIDNVDGHDYLINVRPQVHAASCAKCAEDERQGHPLGGWQRARRSGAND